MKNHLIHTMFFPPTSSSISKMIYCPLFFGLVGSVYKYYCCTVGIEKTVLCLPMSLVSLSNQCKEWKHSAVFKCFWVHLSLFLFWYKCSSFCVWLPVASNLPNITNNIVHKKVIALYQSNDPSSFLFFAQ